MVCTTVPFLSFFLPSCLPSFLPFFLPACLPFFLRILCCDHIIRSISVILSRSLPRSFARSLLLQAAAAGSGEAAAAAAAADGGGGGEWDSDEEDVGMKVEPAPKPKTDFAKMRSQHYNMKAAMQKARLLNAQEDEEDEDSDEDY